MHMRGMCKDHRFYQIISNMAVGWCASFCVCTCARVCKCDRDKQRGQSAAESDEMRWDTVWVHTSRREREVVCVKVDERAREQEREGGHKWLWVSIACYILSVFYLFFCSWSKLRALTQQLGCFSGHSKSCAERVASPKFIVNLMEWDTATY